MAETQPKLSGKMVLVGKAAMVPVSFDAQEKRRPDDQVNAQYDPAHPNAGRGGRGQFGGGRGGRGNRDPNRLTPVEVAEQIDAMLIAGGAVVRLNDAARGEGIIVAQQHRRTIRRRRSRRSSCATTITAASSGCWPTAKT